MNMQCPGFGAGTVLFGNPGKSRANPSKKKKKKEIQELMCVKTVDASL